MTPSMFDSIRLIKNVPKPTFLCKIELDLVLSILFLKAEVFQEDVTLGVSVGVAPDGEVAASHVEAADVVVKSFRIVIRSSGGHKTKYKLIFAIKALFNKLCLLKVRIQQANLF